MTVILNQNFKPDSFGGVFETTEAQVLKLLKPRDSNSINLGYGLGTLFFPLTL